MELQSLVRKIAGCFETGWVYFDTTLDYLARIDGPNGMSISFRRDGERLVVSGKYPNENGTTYPHNGRSTDITVSSKREPLAIAKDICKRFLSEYIISYNIGKDQVDKWVAKVKEKEEKARACYALLGMETKLDYYTKKIRCEGIYTKIGNSTLEIDVRDDIDLKINDLTLEQFKAVLDVLKR